MDVRPYQPADRSACLDVFDSNQPDYFAAHERPAFENFLATATTPYFVMEHEGTIVGCGGYAVDGRSGRLCWGMIRRNLHRHGFGRFLLLYRMRQMTRHEAEIEMVELDTTPRSAPFFLSQGFRILSTVADGYGPGLDRVEMSKRLAVCA